MGLFSFGKKNSPSKKEDTKQLKKVTHSDQILEKVKQCVAEQMNADISTIDMETNLERDLNADSYDFVDIIMMLESEYGIEIPSEED